MYADAQVATMMWEQKTLFPDNWVFGNQYYVVATPVLAALIYGLCGDGIVSMGVASSIMMLAQICLFVWMIKPFTGKTALAAGTFAFGGAVVLGTSICNCTTGAQLFYTMASYYSCYMLGILLVMGLWMRFSTGYKCSKFSLAFSLFYVFCLGLQSLRETLVLVLPLLALELLNCINGKKEKNKARTQFVLAVAAANLCGLLCASFISAPTNKSISGFSPPVSVSALADNISSSFSSFVGISGLRFYLNGIKWIPLTMLAAFICVLAAYVICRIAVKIFVSRNIDQLESLIVFCFISLLAVFSAGVFLGFSLRPIYYFVWFLLTSLCFVYLVENVSHRIFKTLLMLSLVGCGAVNLFYNLYPDFVQYKEQRELLTQTAHKLEAEGIDCIYVEYVPYYTSAIAACSSGEIEAAPVMLDTDAENGFCFRAFPHLVKTSLFDAEAKKNAALVLTQAHLTGSSSFSSFEAMPGSEQSVMDKLELMSVESNQYFDFYIYRILDPSVIER